LSRSIFAIVAIHIRLKTWSGGGGNRTRVRSLAVPRTLAADMGITIPKRRRTAPKHSRAITASEQDFCGAPPSATPSSRSPAEPLVVRHTLCRPAPRSPRWIYSRFLPTKPRSRSTSSSRRAAPEPRSRAHRGSSWWWDGWRSPWINSLPSGAWWGPTSRGARTTSADGRAGRRLGLPAP
jgi:hypothetical protein